MQGQVLKAERGLGLRNRLSWKAEEEKPAVEKREEVSEKGTENLQ